MKQISEISAEIHRTSYDQHPQKLAHVVLVATVQSLCDDLR